LLALGLEFKLPKFKINYTDYFFSFEKILQTVKNLKTYKTDFEIVKQDIKSIANQYYYKFKTHKVFSYLINKADLRILKNLKLNKQIIICRPDKGNGVVLMNKLDYINKMNTVLNNDADFNKCNLDIFKLSLKLEDSLNHILRKLLKNKKIDKIFYNNAFASGSSPGILYGLPKIHKTDIPLRPILSAINSHNFKLAKCLIPLVTPYSSNLHTINNSYNFKEWLLKIDNVHQHFMASFDITSLYTNIPTSDAINILLDRIFAQQNLYHNLNKKEFGQLLNFAAKDTYFIFNNELFHQKNSLAMGSPLSAILANTYLSHYEIQWLNKCPETFKPSHYKRYMDDTFLLFKEQHQVKPFLDFLNKQLPNINFTAEQETEGSLPFLDLLITKDNLQINTSIYRKKTNTTLGINFFSHIPLLYKLNAIKIFIYRAYHLSSSYLALNTEFDYLGEFFLKNAFNLDTVYQLQQNFLNKIYHPSINNITVPKQTVYLKLPYFEQIFHKLKRNLISTLQKNYPQIDFRLVFYNSFSIKNFCNHKDSIPKFLRSGVVYEFTCGDCSVSYIGSTSRQLQARFSEHKGLSYRSNLPLNNPPNSSIYNHCHNNKHNLDADCFKILNNHNQPDSLRILESLAIKQFTPQLNADSGPYQLLTI